MSPRVFVLAVALATAAACGSGPTPPPPPPAAPTVSCPASLSVESPDNVPLPVSFTVPTASGGQSPVTVTCSAQPGANFPLGSTVVTCTATDSLQRTASCNFNVAVTPTPRISKTKFLAFGDSITNGRCNISPDTCPPYTDRFRELLVGRYTRQSFTVIKSGVNGETASNDVVGSLDRAGEDRLPIDLMRERPEVLLLMEGVNDLFHDRVTGVALAIESLGRMIDSATGQGVTVFIATVPPQRENGAFGRTEVARQIPGFNAQLKAMATSKGVNLVDVNAAMSADLNRYIGPDDLHPTAEGLRLIGETFYAAVREKLDTTPTPISSSLFTRR
jgi:lysophospholipase L1-like esterase